MCFSGRDLKVGSGETAKPGSVGRITGLPENLTLDQYHALQPAGTGYLTSRRDYDRYRKLKGTYVAEGDELPPEAGPGPARVQTRIDTNRVGAGDLRIRR